MPLFFKPLEVLNDKKPIDIKAREQNGLMDQINRQTVAPRKCKGPSNTMWVHDRQRRLNAEQKGMRRHAREKRKSRHDGAVIHTARGFIGPDDPHPPHRPLNRLHPPK